MKHLQFFKGQNEVIKELGEGNAHLIWVMSMYLDNPSPLTLASEGLTDGGDDKKIDFIILDRDNRKIVFAQGYYSGKKTDSAPANKASDLNTASAWLLSGDIKNVPDNLKPIVKDCREAITNKEIDQIDLLYIHNLPESVNVAREIATVTQHLTRSLPDDSEITVIGKELGLENIEKLFLVQKSSIEVKDVISISKNIVFEESGPKWKAGVLSVSGQWLRDLFLKHGDSLFSANYRGFLGSSRKRKINSGIRTTAEKSPENFWVFNNGITILTTAVNKKTNGIELAGISIINGAQTTGSIGTLDSHIDLSNVNVLTRIIECSDPATIEDIVKYNNTQNRITTWDKFSNDPLQRKVQKEFESFGHDYTLKRGFDANSSLGIEVVAQPSIALQGYFQEANAGKNGIFESEKMYRVAFEDKKARFLLFAFIISKAFDERRLDLKNKSDNGSILSIERNQLILMRNLRFKYFFMAIFGECLDIIMGKTINLSEVGFSPDASKQSQKSIHDLIVLMLPVVNMVLTFTVSNIQTDLSELIKKDGAIKALSNSVESLIYAQEATNPSPAIAQFRKIVI